MLSISVPTALPWTQLRSGDVLGSGSSVLVDTRQPRSGLGRALTSDGTAPQRQQSARTLPLTPAGSRGGRSRLVVAQAASHGGASAFPGGSREAAERRRALLKYVHEVQPALIDQFVACGPPAVVAAMRNTITNMLGTLPPQFFTVTISTVGENLSQLMLSVMMTGYLFRNAQYRLELHSALGGGMQPPQQPARTTSSGSSSRSVDSRRSSSSSSSGSGSGGGSQQSLLGPAQGTVLDHETYAPGAQKSRVQGDVLLWHKENGVETLAAVQYMEMLETEVVRLRQQLQQQPPAGAGAGAGAGALQQPQLQLPAAGPGGAAQQQQQPQQLGGGAAPGGRQLPMRVQRSGSSQQGGAVQASGGVHGVLSLHEEGGANEVLDYLRALDTASLAELTADGAGGEVAAAMEGFVARLMGTQDRDSLMRVGSDCTAQELAKVMFWLMVVGYSLRGLEVRWDMQRSAGDVQLSCDECHEAW